MFMPRKRGYDSSGVSVPKRSACVFVRRSLSAAFFCASILSSMRASVVPCSAIRDLSWSFPATQCRSVSAPRFQSSL